jgi:ubiquinone/menaquinone biosynthesis C-methylase UbiE
MDALERQTGQLFSDLWHRYDDDAFKQSVLLFEKRWRANGENPDFFKGRKCLDAGCGGGRYSIAMGMLGAEQVVGLDVGVMGLDDARCRAASLGLNQVSFKEGTVLELPFADGSFDFVCCSGVLHHTRSVERGLREINRVLRPGGSVYLLLYGAGGLYWPLNLLVRSYAGALGHGEVDRAISAAGLSASKRRTILDDLFVPILETYTTERVEALLRDAGFAQPRRWKTGHNDHESDPEALIQELEIRVSLWTAGAKSAPDAELARLEGHLAQLSRTAVNAARELLAWSECGRASPENVRQAIIGEGHHRVIAERPIS